jgi:hypothetical protein
VRGSILDQSRWASLTLRVIAAGGWNSYFFARTSPAVDDGDDPALAADCTCSRTGENPPYGMRGGIEETSASFEARSAPRSYPTLPRRIVHQDGRGRHHRHANGDGVLVVARARHHDGKDVCSRHPVVVMVSKSM